MNRKINTWLLLVELKKKLLLYCYTEFASNQLLHKLNKLFNLYTFYIYVIVICDINYF